MKTDDYPQKDDSSNEEDINRDPFRVFNDTYDISSDSNEGCLTLIICSIGISSAFYYLFFFYFV
jgi:hypothetical protein